MYVWCAWRVIGACSVRVGFASVVRGGSYLRPQPENLFHSKYDVTKYRSFHERMFSICSATISRLRESIEFSRALGREQVTKW